MSGTDTVIVDPRRWIPAGSTETDQKFDISRLASNGTTGTAGTAIVLAGAPTITTSVTVPIVIGGTGTTSTLILRSTSGNGTTGADIIFQTGNNGATEAMRILNSGDLGVGIAAPLNRLHVYSTTSADGLSIDGTTFPAVVLRISGAIKGYAPAIVTTNAGFFSDALTGDFAFRSETNNILLGQGSGASTLRICATNVGIGTSTFGTSAAGVLAMANGTAPSSSPSGEGQFYVESGAAKYRGSSGTTTTLAAA